MTLRRLQRRANAFATLRSFFADLDFLEVDPPMLIPANAVEAHIEPLFTRLRPGADAPRISAQLCTSPELAMKRILALGAPRIYRLGHVFRDGEVTLQHRPEFTLVEWYRAGATLDDLIEDCRLLCIRFGLGDKIERITCRDLFARHQIDLDQALELDDLPARVGVHFALRPGADFEDAFFRVMEEAEKGLGFDSPCVVEQWPAQMAALSRLDDDKRYCKRFELYIRGIEVANAFDELTDPAEQRARFDADNKKRQDPLPVDENFLSALGQMPDAAGIALGVERLLMLADDKAHIADVLYFPDDFCR